MIAFFVPGVPAPGGSKRGFWNPKAKRVIITDASPRARPWKALVSDFALEHVGKAPGFTPLEGAISLELFFVMPRPKSHFRTGKNADQLKLSAPIWHVAKPDVLKLARPTEDALTGILWRDDSQIADETLQKLYGPRPGVLVRARLLEREDALVGVGPPPTPEEGDDGEIDMGPVRRRDGGCRETTRLFRLLA